MYSQLLFTDRCLQGYQHVLESLRIKGDVAVYTFQTFVSTINAWCRNEYTNKLTVTLHVSNLIPQELQNLPARLWWRKKQNKTSVSFRCTMHAHSSQGYRVKLP